MSRTATVEFLSRQFQPVKQLDGGGDDAVQVGLYGLALANAMKQRLHKQGLQLEPILADDWGYAARVSGLPFALRLLFSSRDTDEPGLYRCTIALSPVRPGWLQRLRKVPVAQAAAQVRAALERILAEDPELTAVSWREPA